MIFYNKMFDKTVQYRGHQRVTKKSNYVFISREGKETLSYNKIENNFEYLYTVNLRNEK